MNEAIRVLQPEALWNNFADLSAVPRASKKEQQVIAFIKNFGEKLALPTTVDEVGNVLITKSATKGMESRETVVLQCHIDMVHQKNSETDFDFETQGIIMAADGDWIKAKGTTLGADNGIGVAAIMSVLQSSDIAHPALEALFTIDEETGMTGAKGLKPGFLSGNILLNLDTEDDDELTIGCAGGIDVTADGSYNEVSADGLSFFNISVKGLKGGHSGVDIHLGRANSNKVLNRVLLHLDNELGIGIASIAGGSLRNAIPREANAVVAVASEKENSLTEKISSINKILKNEYAATDKDLELLLEKTESQSKICDSDFQQKWLRCMAALHNGIYRMTPGIAGLVQTSNNVAKVQLGNGKFEVLCLTRGSVDSEKNELAEVLRATMQLCGANVVFSGDYPGWAPKPESDVVKLLGDLYQELFGSAAHVNAIHAGLECGIIGAHYPQMQMISFGPNIYGPHSPDERVQISSVQKFWKYLLEVLKNIPEKK